MPLHRLLPRVLFVLVCSPFATPSAAQVQGTGRISGRIFNPATQEYVRNAEVTVDGTDLIAFSGDEGSYVLSNVPAGDVTVAVS